MKKNTKLFAILTIFAMGCAFLSCSTSSGSGSGNDTENNNTTEGSGTGTGTSTSTSTDLNGTYTGYITQAGASTTIYITVTVNDPSYVVKQYSDQAKTTCIATITGTINAKQETVRGWGFNGTGSDHNVAVTPAGNNQYNVLVNLLTGNYAAYNGVITKQ